MSTAPIPTHPPENFASRLAGWSHDRIVTTQDLMWLFQVTDDSITRAIKRGELPPPVTMGGMHVWTVGALHAHLAERLQEAKRDAQREQRRRDAKVQSLYGGEHGRRS